MALPERVPGFDVVAAGLSWVRGVGWADRTPTTNTVAKAIRSFLITINTAIKGADIQEAKVIPIKPKIKNQTCPLGVF